MPQLYEDRARAESFGAKAERYDRLRPSYPPALIAWLTADGPGTAIDVGCGTGRVAQLLVDAGWQVQGVEPDERMASVARARGIPVAVAHFEDWRPTVASVDLVSSGQAWHWVEPEAGYGKAAEVLRPGGRFAAFWNLYRYDAPIAAAVAEVYGRHAPELLVDSVPLGTAVSFHDLEDHRSIDASGRFRDTGVRRFEHHREQRVTDWLDELTTHAMHSRVDPSLLATLMAELSQALGTLTDGTLTVRYETSVVTGVRAAAA